MGLDGAMVQIISDGLVSGALFFSIGVLYSRMHSRQIADYGGVVNTMPVFASFMVLFAMANAGLPGTSGFVGEFLVILSAFRASFWYAAGSCATAGSDIPASTAASRASISRSFWKVIPSMSVPGPRPTQALAASALAASVFLRPAYLRLKRSTRPATSSSRCLPVKKGWQAEQISRRISFFVDRVVQVAPQAQWTLTTA